MAIRRIRQLGDPVLRQISIPAKTLEAAPVLRDLRDTLHEFQRTHGFGRGISAVQIGLPKRLIYIEMSGREYALCNAEYEFRSDEVFCLWDDCFSFPDLLVHVERFQSVRVRYDDESGQPRVIEADGAFSELLQHEIDHQDGVLAIDRAIDLNSFSTREEWTRQNQK